MRLFDTSTLLLAATRHGRLDWIIKALALRYQNRMVFEDLGFRIQPGAFVARNLAGLFLFLLKAQEACMSDLIDGNDGAGAEKHGQARALVEAALRARREGEDDRADLLMEQARHVDPEAVEDVLMEIEPNELAPDEAPAGDPATIDREIELMSRQIEPGSDAPSRAGITGAGSGADSQGE